MTESSDGSSHVSKTWPSEVTEVPAMLAAAGAEDLAAHAQEVARRAALHGRTVSGWLALLVADALSAGPSSSDQGRCLRCGWVIEAWTSKAWHLAVRRPCPRCVRPR